MATAKPTQASVSKTVVLNATLEKAKPAPGTLDVGQVVKVTNSNGRVEYYVGTANGGVSKPLTSVNSAVSQVTNEVKKAERIQITALTSANKIEELELKQELKEQGVPTSVANKIIADEKKVNASEVKQFTSLLAEPALQYGVRDQATNTFVNNVVNGVTTPAIPPASLLTYNDPVIAPIVQNNIKSANNAVAEFQLLHGITQQYVGKGDNQEGIDPVAIYQALDGNHIQTIRDPATNKVIDYKFSDEVLKAKGDQSGLMNAIGGEAGFGKNEARTLGQILSANVLIDQPVAIEKDAKGNLYVAATTLDANGKPVAQKDANGKLIDRYADQNALVDTGQTIQIDVNKETGAPIYGKVFAELATDNSKRNYVSVVNSYIQQPDGTFKFGGVSDMSYTHIQKMDVGDIAKAAAIGAASIAAGYYAGPLLGLSGSAATVAGGLAAGATGSALTGSNVIEGALQGAVFAYGIDAVQQAIQAAGGVTELGNQLLKRDFSSFTEAGQKAAEAARAAAAANAGDDIVQKFLDTTSVLGDTTGLTDASGFIPIRNLGNSTFNLDGSLFGAANGIFTNNLDVGLTNRDISNWSNNNSLIQDTLNQMYDPNLQTVVNPNGSIKTIDLSNSALNTDGTLRNVDTIVTNGGGAGGGDGGGAGGDGTGLLGNDTLTNTLVIGGGVLAADKIKDALTPKAPATETYTAPLINNVVMPKNTVPNLVQNYNNLFNRQGVGAGQFLGYDYLNNINVPQDLMGLLGTSAQARPTSLTMPTPTSITPA